MIYSNFNILVNETILLVRINYNISYIRAIRTRTVDLLGKTDQTDYYQNDSNWFKDPTCLFFCIGLFH